MVAPGRFRRLIPSGFLLLLTVVLAYAVLALSTPIAQADRDGRDAQNLFLLALGILGLGFSIYWWRVADEGESRRALGWLALLLPCYAAFQLIPVPLAVLRLLSPARAELTQALVPLSLPSSYAPFSVAPSLTLIHLLLFAGYAVVFFLVREIARSNRDIPWWPALPIIGIAAWQGAWGVSQFLARGAQPFAHGTYPVRNHFAGLLEMSLPFALAYSVAALRNDDTHTPISAGAAFRAGAGFTAAALIIVGILTSLSRMGFLACAGSLIGMGVLALSGGNGRARWPMLAALGLAAALAIAFLLPTQLLVRFSDVSSEGRVDVWRDTLHLIAAYPVFGVGLGGYQPAFDKFKTSGFIFSQDYAHNDYLQFLAELGIAGFLIAGAFLLLILIRALRASLDPSEHHRRWLGIACSGALVAILTHSAADFNLYVPANATLLAWICGVTAGGLVDSRQ